jgi:hypothetical protein
VPKHHSQVSLYPVITKEDVDELIVIATTADIMPLQDTDNDENDSVEQRSRKKSIFVESLKSEHRRSSSCQLSKNIEKMLPKTL